MSTPAPAPAAPPPAAAPTATTTPALTTPAVQEERWQHLQWLPCRLEVQLSVPRLTVGDVIRLAPRVVVETHWQQNADVPIRANGQLIAWAEFEGIDEKLAVRVTRLA
ncbi:MAG TPA: FliM/FliN family flagellar motor C-terminal domain-containing protein [Terriglobales bacterium]|nr:FliM/FliN family flagellar motor C-terminal domain-containing protein [Terriglobales bacterium]